MSRTLLLVRHGETDYNATGRMQGQLDTALSARGRAQAGEIAAVIAGYEPSLVLTSDLSRAADTARRIAAAADRPLHVDQRLRETHLGHWQGMSRDDVDAQYPGQRAYWRHSAEWAPPGGESRVDVAARTRQLVDELMATHTGWEDGPVVLVAHGGSIAALTHSLLDVPLSRNNLVGGLGNGCFAQLQARPEFNLDNPPAPDAPLDYSGPVQWTLQCWNRSRSFAVDLAAER